MLKVTPIISPVPNFYQNGGGPMGKFEGKVAFVTFLASNDAGWVTGSALPLAGGWPSD